MDERGLLGQADAFCCACLQPVYSVMSIYIVGGGRCVYVILNILLIFLEIVRLLCVLVS